MNKLEEGFQKAAPDNLPEVDSDMINDFFIANMNFISAEVRNVKTKRSTRESYGDKAVAYVQLKRSGLLCTVKAKITPEHKIHNKAYTVCAVINEQEHQVISSECLDCPASKGGCKHGVAFLLWLHRRSEEPPVTSTVCYWKASSLSKVSRSSLTLDSVFPIKKPKLKESDPSILDEVITTWPNSEGALFTLFRKSKYDLLSLHQLGLNYSKREENQQSPEDFLEFLKSVMTDDMCRQAEMNSRDQAMSKDWYELRYGRITASVVYESAKCKTVSGSLKEKLLGASLPFENEAISRGKKLEPEVLNEVSKLKNIKINKAGLFLKKEHPIFGASPDGISEDYAIEIKCPSKEKTIEQYILRDEITKKFWCQIQMQMLFCNKKKSLFCVASPNFENDKKVQIIEIKFDEEGIKEYMDHAEIFWKKIIYPSIIGNNS